MSGAGVARREKPRLVAVQADGCAPIVEAWKRRAESSDPWPEAKTIAFGITVPKALGDFLVLRAVYETDGYALAVSDDDILSAQSRLGRLEGAFICPEGAACFAAAARLASSGWIAPDEQVVIYNTGTGIKYPETVSATVPTLTKGSRIPIR